MSGHKKKSSLDTALRRGASRLAAVQALYQLDMGGGPLDDISRDFLTGVQGGEVIEEDPVMETEKPVILVGLNAEMFTILLRGVDADRAALDEIINASLAKGWDAARLQPLLRNVLRLGIFELRARHDIPRFQRKGLEREAPVRFRLEGQSGAGGFLGNLVRAVRA